MKRVLITSVTARGSASATGQLIDTLFSQLENVETFSLHAGHPAMSEEHAQIRFSLGSIYRVWRQICEFRPEIFYVRPTLKPFALNLFTCFLVVALSPRVIVHVMDDEANDRTHGSIAKRFCFSKYLGWLLHRAAHVFTISPGMSQAFYTRYGIESQPLSNVTRSNKPSKNRGPISSEKLKVGYFGSLDSRMNATCVTKICEVFESINELGFSITFDIYTRPMYRRWAEANFEFLNTNLYDYVPAEDYERTLHSYDVLLIAYNFDDISVQYCRYSIANKLADYINAGTPILIVGPEAIETVALCKNHRIGTTLSKGYPSLGEDLLSYVKLLVSDEIVVEEYAKRHSHALQLDRAYDTWSSVFC